MNVYVSDKDTRLRYIKEDNCKKYTLPIGFKAFIFIDSGKITNISILDKYLSKNHEQIRYQILGADTSLATVYLSKRPKITFNSSYAECDRMADWFNSIVSYDEPKNVTVNVMHYTAILRQYEEKNYSTVAEALSHYQLGDTLNLKDGNNTVVTLSSYKGENGLYKISLTTSLYTESKILREIWGYYQKFFD